MSTFTWIERASDCEQRRRISLQEKHENVIAAVKKGEMIAASKVKMGGSKKIKSEQEHKQQNLS